jgi:excisionase family DNA binding protein
VTEAAKLLKVSRATVYRLVAERKLRAVRVSHAIRIQLPDAGAPFNGAGKC